jgi:hypothetical protein
MKSIFKNKLNLFLFFLIVINLIYIKNISYFNLEILKNSFNKNWIPIYSIYRDEVIESKQLLKKNEIGKFNVSQQIGTLTDAGLKSVKAVEKSDKYTHFRMITYNYPIKFDSNSIYFLFFKNEKAPKECKELDKGQYLKLLIC